VKTFKLVTVFVQLNFVTCKRTSS